MTIDDVIETNEAAGQFFFSAGAMGFFNSKIESDLINDEYFVTSEQFVPSRGEPGPRLYTVRRAIEGGIRIGTVGRFQGYKTRYTAMAAAKAQHPKENAHYAGY